MGGGLGSQLFIWNFRTNQWEGVGSHYAGWSDQWISKTYTSGFSDYIQGGYLYLVAIPSTRAYGIFGLTSLYLRTNYVEVSLTPTLPGLIQWVE